MEMQPSTSKLPLLITVVVAIAIGLGLLIIASKTRQSRRELNYVTETNAQEKVLPPEPVFDAYFKKGNTLYLSYCSSCHASMGQGIPNNAPPLNDPKWLTDERLFHIIKLGLKGKLTLQGKDYDLAMPAIAQEWSDYQLAGIMTYVQNNFGEKEKEVTTLDRIKQLQSLLDKRTGKGALTPNEVFSLPSLPVIQHQPNYLVDPKSGQPTQTK